MSSITYNEGEDVFCVATGWRLHESQIAVQSDPNWGVVHTGMRSTQMAREWDVTWDRASPQLVKAIADHYEGHSAKVFKLRRQPNEDGERVQYSAAPQWVWDAGGGLAKVSCRVLVVRGKVAVAIPIPEVGP